MSCDYSSLLNACVGLAQDETGRKRLAMATFVYLFRATTPFGHNLVHAVFLHGPNEGGT